MNLQETQEFDADPDRVFAMLCDQAWREEVCRATHAIDYSVSVEKSDGTVTVRTTRVLPAEIPEPFKSMVGDRIEIVQVETWPAEPDSDGTRRAEVDMQISKQPASMTGTITLQPNGSGARRAVNGDIRVKIPLLGRRIEPEIAKAVRAALDKEQQSARTYLSS
ncbi:MAG TPA: DUF2505 domain-containing protein [Nocardioidaceae bacterium]|nr:DUF2505 domain-containing protein [Nocardioidaceae bacterium]